MEENRRALSILDFVDMICGYDSNGDGVDVVRKYVVDEMLRICIENSIVGSASPWLEDAICALQ